MVQPTIHPCLPPLDNIGSSFSVVGGQLDSVATRKAELSRHLEGLNLSIPPASDALERRWLRKGPSGLLPRGVFLERFWSDFGRPNGPMFPTPVAFLVFGCNSLISQNFQPLDMEEKSG